VREGERVSAGERRFALLDPAAGLTVGACALLIAGTVAARAPHAGDRITYILLAAGALGGVAALRPTVLRVRRAHPVLTAAAVLAFLLLVLAVGGLVVAGLGGPTPHVHLGLSLPAATLEVLALAGLVIAVALVGLVLLADDLRRRLAAPAAETGWETVTGDGTRRAPAPARGSRARAVLGAGLLVVAFVGAVVLASGGAGHGVAGLAVLVGIALAALGAAVLPLAVAALSRAERARVQEGREQERRRVVAHLHDSVLQTLALMHRQAGDPAAVQRLARRQELELREWMAGRRELGERTLAGALHEVADGVQADHQDLRLRVSITGDRALDDRGLALAGAAREALRNAARHAGGEPVTLYGRLGDDEAEVYVRDNGPGFDLAAVPAERRGVRDSIVERMRAAGGSARIESVRDAGTEITLRIAA
jgi:signal transduction histidine kinase